MKAPSSNLQIPKKLQWASSQPGGLTELSRGQASASERRPRLAAQNTPRPGGAQEACGVASAPAPLPGCNDFVNGFRGRQPVALPPAKFRAPSGREGRCALSVKSKLRVAFAYALLVLGGWSFFGIWSLEIGASPAFGPAISVPIDLPRESRPLPAPNLIDQSREAAALKSRGCLECHVGTDEHTMHKSPNVVLGCTDCHGGNATPGLLMRKAHVAPRHGE